jgi:hypothetical protein
MNTAQRSKRVLRHVVLWACLIASLSLPSLATRFDFIDDGNLVYPSPPMALAQRVQVAWQKVRANYEDLGPFRPVLWAHWEIQADLFQADAFRWRLARTVWAMLAAATFLWLLIELRMQPAAAVLTTALAMWNPYRSEIWRSLTLSEGVAMPYAVMALVCAVRANRVARSWRWDVTGMLCVLAALGCKNTFAAVVPAQVLLRVAPDGQDLRQAWRHHGWRAAALALTLLLPLLHFIIFKLTWHPGQYVTGGPSTAQLGRMLYTIKGAAGIDFIGPGLLIAIWVVWTAGNGLWARYRAGWIAGLALLACGIAIYLPMAGVARRYAIPAVWGADLWIAALLSALAEATATVWKRIAQALLYAGLVAVAMANLGHQDRFAARAAMLWQALEFTEQHAPQDARFAWVDGTGLEVEEAVHFYWHLRARGRGDLRINVLDADGRLLSRPELPAAGPPFNFLFSGSDIPPAGDGWVLLREFTAFYWGRYRRYACYLWQRQPAG